MHFITAIIGVIVMTISVCFCVSDDESYICDEDTSVDITDGVHFSNGDINFKGVTYNRKEYIVDNSTGIERGCICAKEKCIRKCCPFGLAYNPNKRACVEVKDKFDPPIWDKFKLLPDDKASELFNIVFGRVNCTGTDVRVIVGTATKGYHLINDGNLYLELPNSIPPWMIRPPDKYCIDTFVFDDPDTGMKHTNLDALICFAADQDQNHYLLSSTCMLISCVFILATLAVYAWLPELRNLHGRVLMAYLLCLFTAFLSCATMQILLVRDNISRHTCVSFTFLIYFSLQSAFFWLNVMSFDIWWTFSGKRGITLEKLSTRARFWAYSLYAFGVPTLLTILLAALEFSGLPKNPFLPLIRDQGCFIHGMSKLIYLYGPMVLIIFANLIFFVLTAVKITQISQQTSVLKSKESSTHDQHRNDKQRLFLYVKLFTVMGINWILEVVSAVYPKMNSVWSFTDAYNILIGVFVFIIFVCKRKIFRLIKKRIKERFHQPIDDIGELTIFTNRNVSRWKLNQGPRASLESIRTVISTDPDASSLKIKPN